jgi:rare lipoprotein A
MLSRLFTCFLLSLPILLTACSENMQDSAPSLSMIKSMKISPAIPVSLPKSRYGNPTSYVVNNKRYFVLKTAKDYSKIGIASWYGTKFHGRLTSSREPYDMMAMTAASPELPIPCFAKVTNLENNRSVIVKVNDRGPFAKGRIIDLSYAAAKELDFTKQGTTRVKVTTIDTAPTPKVKNSKLIASIDLQVGVFRNFYNAKKMQERAQSIVKYPVSIERDYSKGLYRVKIGPIKNRFKNRVIAQLNATLPTTRALTIPHYN